MLSHLAGDGFPISLYFSEKSCEVGQQAVTASESLSVSMTDPADVDFNSLEPDALELYIKLLNRGVKESHDLAMSYRAEGRRYAALVGKAVAARSPETVARMEREAGL